MTVPTLARRRLKYAVVGCFNGVWGDEPNGADDLTVVRVADFDRERARVSLSDPPTIRAIPQSARNRRVLARGDLLIEKSGGGEQMPVGNVVIFDEAIPAVCSNFVARLPVVHDCSPRFVNYVFQALYNEGRNVPHIKQTSGIQNLNSDSYLNELAWLPPRPEQERIANFLDEKTARIDALIAEKESLLERLIELQRSYLAEEMDKALASGSSQLRHCLSFLGQGWSPLAENHAALATEWGVLKLSAIKNGRFAPEENKALSPGTHVPVDIRLRKGDVLVTRANTPELVGAAALVDHDELRLIPSDLIYTLRVKPQVLCAHFLVQFLLSPQARVYIEVEARGSSQSMVKLSQEHIKSLPVPAIPLAEQMRIADRLSAIYGRTQGLLQHTGEHITRLREYRSSLVSATVTGELDPLNSADQILGSRNAREN